MPRPIVLLLVLAVTACQPWDGRPVQAPSGVSSSQVHGDPRVGGADPGFFARGSSVTFGRGR